MISYKKEIIVNYIVKHKDNPKIIEALSFLIYETHINIAVSEAIDSLVVDFSLQTLVDLEGYTKNAEESIIAILDNDSEAFDEEKLKKIYINLSFLKSLSDLLRDLLLNNSTSFIFSFSKKDRKNEYFEDKLQKIFGGFDEDISEINENDGENITEDNLLIEEEIVYIENADSSDINIECIGEEDFSNITSSEDIICVEEDPDREIKDEELDTVIEELNKQDLSLDSNVEFSEEPVGLSNISETTCEEKHFDMISKTDLSKDEVVDIVDEMQDFIESTENKTEDICGICGLDSEEAKEVFGDTDLIDKVKEVTEDIEEEKNLDIAISEEDSLVSIEDINKIEQNNNLSKQDKEMLNELDSILEEIENPITQTTENNTEALNKVTEMLDNIEDEKISDKDKPISESILQEFGEGVNINLDNDISSDSEETKEDKNMTETIEDLLSIEDWDNEDDILVNTLSEHLEDKTLDDISKSLKFEEEEQVSIKSEEFRKLYSLGYVLNEHNLFIIDTIVGDSCSLSFQNNNEKLRDFNDELIYVKESDLTLPEGGN